MSIDCKQSDGELVTLLAEGNPDAFSAIYERYWERMVDYAVRLTRSEEEAADIVQEVFVSIWRRKANIAVDDTLAPYLLKSTRNLCLQYIERNFKKHAFLERFSKHMSSSLSLLDDKIDVERLRGRIEIVVDQLPSKMRTIYILSRAEQLSHKEIALRLGIAETTVKKQISNALKIISSSLKHEYSFLLLLVILRNL